MLIFRWRWISKSYKNNVHTWPKVVLSMRPLTIRAVFTLLLHSRAAVMMGVLILLAPFIISLIRGTPSVTSNTELKYHIGDQKKKIQKTQQPKALGKKVPRVFQWLKGYSCLQHQQSGKFLMSSVSQALQYYELQLHQLQFQLQFVLIDNERCRYPEKPSAEMIENIGHIQ